ncbi:glutathione S-transferase family protein [Aquabacterium sp.]|uniref:glutathione S-transferase family protein n=1 Tax=Aquabacterium sp. TaxID=1872578 RepID=UPI0037845759
MKPLPASATALPFTVGDAPVLVSHALCPYVQRASIVLAEKGVAFQRVDIDLAHKPDWFTALSPLGKTPMLLLREGDGVTALFESAVICDYLDETRAPALHPAAPLARARHRAWVEVASATLNTIWQLYTARDDAAFDTARRALRQRAVQLDAELAARGPGPWFAGAAFSLVDAAFAPVWRYFEVIDPIIDTGVFAELPQLAAWRDALARRGSVREAVRSDYPQRLREFIVRQGGVLGQRAQALAV